MARLNWRLERLEGLLQKTAEGLGYDFWGMEYVRASGADVLRLYIEVPDNPGGITAEDCTRVSEHLHVLLEVDSPISGQYVLEVSSPGLERRLFRLEQCHRAVGERVRLRLRVSLSDQDNRRNLVGDLLAVGEDSLRVRLGQDEAEYKWADLERVQVVPDWNPGPGRRLSGGESG